MGAVKDVVNKVLSTGKDVVMIFHSYGGVVGCEALKEYVNEHETGKSGKQGWGRIRRLVFVAAFVLPEGGSLMAGLGFKPLPWFNIDGEAVNPANPKEIFYNDLSDSEAQIHIAALKQHSYLTFASTLTAAPWKTIPSTYILCEKDNAIPLQGQEVWSVKSLKTSSPTFASNPLPSALSKSPLRPTSSLWRTILDDDMTSQLANNTSVIMALHTIGKLGCTNVLMGGFMSCTGETE